ncbi:histidine phosphatase family protein [Paenibacillus hemerocallicola]|uniref:Histidine phosphatase family protein n=1 Tax=Paenibacillus hemerocallicola TaxID=1172614 RepID=A0A5C4T974_9BACL|nr:histidine phosphatase family protein [Paenibacillus hemerocallicola]TNJ65628.1 histidine phosphatase family protein [Paenibacillus hemerocallicola]
MDLFLIRHGQSIGNTVTYDMADGELTELGRSQAGKVLAGMKDAGVTHIVSSPLQRAIETAQPLARATGLPIRVWTETFEVRSKGAYRGPTGPEMRKAYPEIGFEDEIEPEGWYCSGDEDEEKAHGRALRVLERLRREFPGDERVALFSHSGFNRRLLLAALGLDHRSGVRFLQSNGTMFWLHIGGEGVDLRYIGDFGPLFG